MVEDQSSANELAGDNLSNRQAGTFQITKGEPELILALVLPLRDLELSIVRQVSVAHFKVIMSITARRKVVSKWKNNIFRPSARLFDCKRILIF